MIGAIGFVGFVIGCTIEQGFHPLYGNYRNYSRWVRKITNYVVLTSICMMVASCAIWLWRVAP
jgi:hypothetical protein